MARRPYGTSLAWGDHVIVVGLQQTGKSTLARALAADARRVLVFDPKGDHATKLRGVERGPDGKPGVAPIALEALLTPDPAEPDPRWRIVVLAGREGVPVSQECKYVVRKAREYVAATRLGIVLMLDELVLYSSACGEALRSLLANGHGTAPEDGGIVSVLIAQRAVDLPLGCRALATRAYSFRQKHPRDLERLEDEFGATFRRRAETWSAGQPPAKWEQERFYPRG